LEPVNILHLSDAHLRSPSTWDESVIIRGLFSDLKELRHSLSAPQLIVFSGDLAMSGGEPGQYSVALDLLLRVADSVGLDEKSIIVVPGNHDADRAIVRRDETYLAQCRASAIDSTFLNDLVIDPPFIDHVRDKFSNFSDVSESFAQDALIYSDLFSGSYFFRELGVAVVTFNTATLSGAGLNSSLNDLAKLGVAERTIITALERVPAGVPVIVAGHHPASWLNEASEKVMNRSWPPKRRRTFPATYTTLRRGRPTPMEVSYYLLRLGLYFPSGTAGTGTG
jgi:predicted MPP superfamily phosphohydrolase